MITPCYTPQVITFNNKIYVFRCCGEEACKHRPKCRVWAQFFYEESEIWSPLPRPQLEDCLVICSPNHTENSRITKTILVITDNKYVNEFNVETNCWARFFAFANFDFVSTTELPIYPKQPVLVNNVLYWFGSLVYAYDILNDELYSGPLQDFAFQRAMRTWYEADGDCVGAKGGFKPAIIHLGGMYFCLISSLPDKAISHEYPIEYPPSRIHCLTIKVSRTKKSNFLSARAVSCQSFPIDDDRTFIDGQFMIGC